MVEEMGGILDVKFCVVFWFIVINYQWCVGWVVKIIFQLWC